MGQQEIVEYMEEQPGMKATVDELEEALECSRDAVYKALSRLETKDEIEAVQGEGYFEPTVWKLVDEEEEDAVQVARPGDSVV